jgi:RNA polymerase-interacting CarD/CdnL/TRCF family regulator
MIAKEDMRFHIGELIVHDNHGIGKVKSITKKGLKKKTYYEVKTNDLTYWLPIENQDKDHVKPIRSKDEFEDAIKLMATKPKLISEKYKNREKKIHDRWQNGDLESRAKLIRDLHGRLSRIRLSFNEKDTFEKTKEAFIDEWIISDETLTRSNAMKRMNAALKKSSRKIKKTDFLE